MPIVASIVYGSDHLVLSLLASLEEEEVRDTGVVFPDRDGHS